MVLPIAQLTNDELHCPLGPDEGAIAQRAVATDAIRPTHAHTHTDRTRTSTGTQKHAISISRVEAEPDSGHTLLLIVGSIVVNL